MLICLGIIFSSFTGAANAYSGDSTGDSKEDLRVYIEGTKNEITKVRKQFKTKRDFGDEGFTAIVNPEELKAIKKNRKLKVQKVSIVKIAQTNILDIVFPAAVPSSRTPWGIRAIYSEPAIAQTTGGKGIKVAVLDTGTSKTHKDLASKIEQCKNFTSVFSTIVNNSCTDRNGHGTHVSGTILANGGSDGSGIFGVAPEAKLWAYKVLGDSGTGYSDDIAAAIRHAADQAASTGSRVIISMSLGSSSKDSLIAGAVDYAYSKGVLVVAAAGN